MRLDLVTIKFIDRLIYFLLLIISLNAIMPIANANDEQLIQVFTANYTSLVYNITATVQSGTNNLGPAYLLNGMTNKWYWYQAGLAYNFSGHPLNIPLTYYPGFSFVYQVWNPSATLIYPANGTNGFTTFSSPGVKIGDVVQFRIYFLNGNVMVNANDLNSGAKAAFNYTAYGANAFVGLPLTSNPAYNTSNHFFTGLMVEQDHSAAYNGTEQPTFFSNLTLSKSSVIVWMDEFVRGTNHIWNSSPQQFVFSNNPNTFNTFTFNGSVQVANIHYYITGNYPLGIASPTPPSQIVYQSQTAVINDNGGLNAALPDAYQWLEEAPGSSSFTNATNCGSGDSKSTNTVTKCTFTTNLGTTTGTYYFELRLNDSASSLQNAGAIVSNAASVTVDSPIKITITNQQSAATPMPFQDSIVVDSYNYKPWENGGLSNINFTYANGTLIDSWIENSSTNTSTGTVYWLKLNKGISANSNVVVYMHFGPLSSNYFNTQTTGEAPELSSVYGLYDDGSSVFNNYWRFGGPLTSLPSGWQLTTLNPIYNRTNFIFTTNSTNFTKKSPGCYSGSPHDPSNGATTTSTYTITNTLVDFDEVWPEVSCTLQGTIAAGLGGASANSMYFVGPGGGYRVGGTNYGLAFGNWNLQDYLIAYNGTSTGTYGYYYPSTLSVYTVGEYFSTTSNKDGAYFAINYSLARSTTSLGSTTNSSFPITTLITLANESNLFSHYNFSVYWIRTRAAPPNGAMPSASGITQGSLLVPAGSTQSVATISLPATVNNSVVSKANRTV